MTRLMAKFLPCRFPGQWFVGILLACSSMAPAYAEIQLPHLFTEHMVLQRDRPIRVWGAATPSAVIRVAIGEQVQQTAAGQNGKWEVTFPAGSGGPHAFRVTSDKDSNVVEYKDVWYGDVWVCSGQSNMEWSVEQSSGAAEEIPAANYPKIRLFRPPHLVHDQPQEDCDATWMVCTPDSVKSFSAVAYYFGRKISMETDVPIGLIGTYWGGTRGEAWVSQDALRDRPFYRPLMDYKAPADQPQTGASSLFHGMVAPLTRYAIRGAIWYQGESNLGRAEQYARLLPTLIHDWRNHWGQGDFPFYFVQLAPFRYGGTDPGVYAELCEAQAKTLSVPRTGMAVTNDVGDLKDIHPANKKTVGERLALWALANDYGASGISFRGPQFAGCEILGRDIRVHFDHAEGLKTQDGAAPKEFMVAGRDRRFVPASASIDGKTVVVQAAEVPEPIAVRFAWSDSAQPNLVNGAGLPATSFRSDDFRGITEGNWNP
jgi:sialate O-acetylesterase